MFHLSLKYIFYSSVYYIIVHLDQQCSIHIEILKTMRWLYSEHRQRYRLNSMSVSGGKDFQYEVSIKTIFFTNPARIYTDSSLMFVYYNIYGVKGYPPMVGWLLNCGLTVACFLTHKNYSKFCLYFLKWLYIPNIHHNLCWYCNYFYPYVSRKPIKKAKQKVYIFIWHSILRIL